MIIPASVAVVVPIGIDFPGSFKSPDKPTPAVIPVKAGKIIAKTIKKLSKFLKSALARLKFVSWEKLVEPKKNKINVTAKIATT